MSAEPPQGESASQDQIDELAAKVAVNRADIDSLLARADLTNHRAEAALEVADEHGRRLDELEQRSELDRKLIAELVAEGVLHAEQAANLQAALRSSRTIGAAMGIVMADRRVGEEAAFEILRRGSQFANRKLRDIAEEVVRTGDVSGLPWA